MHFTKSGLERAGQTLHIYSLVIMVTCTFCLSWSAKWQNHIWCMKHTRFTLGLLVEGAGLITRNCRIKITRIWFCLRKREGKKKTYKRLRVIQCCWNIEISIFGEINCLFPLKGNFYFGQRIYKEACHTFHYFSLICTLCTFLFR